MGVYDDEETAVLKDRVTQETKSPKLPSDWVTNVMLVFGILICLALTGGLIYYALQASRQEMSVDAAGG